MLCRERGMALINVVVMLAILLALSHILCEKIWQSARQATAASAREQVFWAAQAGIEDARDRLASAYIDSALWSNFLVSETPLTYPATPAWETSLNGINIAVFLRDNEDGDGNHRRDNDLKIYILGRARGAGGAEVCIECLAGFVPASANDPASAARDPENLIRNLAEQPVDTYDVVQ